MLRTILAAFAVCALLTGNAFADIQFFEFFNTNPITITDEDLSNPYPSTITVGALPAGQILNIQVIMNGFTHSFPDDTAAAVVSANGSATLLFSGPATGQDAVNLNFVFDDNAAATLPISAALTSGTFRPGANEYDDAFPVPGPGDVYAFDFSAWLNENPVGDWNLYMLDGFAGDDGSVSGGWGLRFEVNVVPEPSSIGLSLLGLAALGVVRRRR